MANSFLIVRSAALCVALVALQACGPAEEEYAKANPGDIGRKVERLREQVSPGLTASAKSWRAGPSSCGDDSTLKKVKPLPGDPWHVLDNHYRFNASFTMLVKTYDDPPPIYTRLYQFLNRVDGWKIREQRFENGALAGLEGEKEGVRLQGRDLPDGKGNIQVLIELESDCYRHPNA